MWTLHLRAADASFFQILPSEAANNTLQREVNILCSSRPSRKRWKYQEHCCHRSVFLSVEFSSRNFIPGRGSFTYAFAFVCRLSSLYWMNIMKKGENQFQDSVFLSFVPPRYRKEKVDLSPGKNGFHTTAMFAQRQTEETCDDDMKFCKCQQFVARFVRIKLYCISMKLHHDNIVTRNDGKW